MKTHFAKSPGGLTKSFSDFGGGGGGEYEFYTYKHTHKKYIYKKNKTPRKLVCFSETLEPALDQKVNRSMDRQGKGLQKKQTLTSIWRG